jgi:hypothetical protein
VDLGRDRIVFIDDEVWFPGDRVIILGVRPGDQGLEGRDSGIKAVVARVPRGHPYGYRTTEPLDGFHRSARLKTADGDGRAVPVRIG